MKSMPSEYLFGWNHCLHTQMVEKARFWSCTVQVQGPSDSRGLNRCEFKLRRGLGNFPQCKLCILGLCFKEKKGHPKAPADTDLFRAQVFPLTLLLLEPSGLAWIQVG